MVVTGFVPMQVKRVAVRDPFTQSDEIATAGQKGVYEIRQGAAGYNPGRSDVVL